MASRYGKMEIHSLNGDSGPQKLLKDLGLSTDDRFKPFIGAVAEARAQTGFSETDLHVGNFDHGDLGFSDSEINGYAFKIDWDTCIGESGVFVLKHQCKNTQLFIQNIYHPENIGEDRSRLTIHTKDQEDIIFEVENPFSHVKFGKEYERKGFFEDESERYAALYDEAIASAKLRLGKK